MAASGRMSAAPPNPDRFGWSTMAGVLSLLGVSFATGRGKYHPGFFHMLRQRTVCTTETPCPPLQIRALLTVLGVHSSTNRIPGIERPDAHLLSFRWSAFSPANGADNFLDHLGGKTSPFTTETEARARACILMKRGEADEEPPPPKKKREFCLPPSVGHAAMRRQLFVLLPRDFLFRGNSLAVEKLI